MFALDYMESYLLPSFFIVMAIVIAGVSVLAIKGGK
jgi:hypothetical protein